MEFYQCNCNTEEDYSVNDLLPDYVCPNCNTVATLIMLENGCILSLNDYQALKELPFQLTTEEKSSLYISLVTQGLNDGQISDVFQRIKTKEDYFKYLKS